MARHRTLVTLPPDLVAEIDLMVGARKRSAFLAELARREIKRQRLLKVFESPEPLWRDDDHPELKDGAEDYIRKLRSEAEDRLQRVQTDV
jgi:hypothetical protein